jgi:hypothetical protein
VANYAGAEGSPPRLSGNRVVADEYDVLDYGG